MGQLFQEAIPPSCPLSSLPLSGFSRFPVQVEEEEDYKDDNNDEDVDFRFYERKREWEMRDKWERKEKQRIEEKEGY